MAASARATTPPGSFGSKSVEPALTRSPLLVPDVPAPNCLLRCIRLPGPPGNSDAHDQDAACSPAPSSVHGHDTANAPALPMPPMEDIHDRLAACQPLASKPTAPGPDTATSSIPSASTLGLAPPPACRGGQPASRGLNGPPNCLLRCGRAATATGPDHPVLRVTSLLGTAATFPEPTLSPKCSQDWLHFPSFPPVSRSKRPPTSLLGTDANPCTRVRHHIRLPERHLTASDGPWTTCTAPDGPRMITCLHVAGMWLQLGCGQPLADFPFGNSPPEPALLRGTSLLHVVLA